METITYTIIFAKRNAKTKTGWKIGRKTVVSNERLQEFEIYEKAFGESDNTGYDNCRTIDIIINGKVNLNADI